MQDGREKERGEVIFYLTSDGVISPQYIFDKNPKHPTFSGDGIFNMQWLHQCCKNANMTEFEYRKRQEPALFGIAKELLGCELRLGSTDVRNFRSHPKFNKNIIFFSDCGEKKIPHDSLVCLAEELQRSFEETLGYHIDIEVCYVYRY